MTGWCQHGFIFNRNDMIILNKPDGGGNPFWSELVSGRKILIRI
jgi:hypothetical protein